MSSTLKSVSHFFLCHIYMWHIYVMFLCQCRRTFTNGHLLQIFFVLGVIFYIYIFLLQFFPKKCQTIIFGLKCFPCLYVRPGIKRERGPRGNGQYVIESEQTIGGTWTLCRVTQKKKLETGALPCSYAVHPYLCAVQHARKSEDRKRELWK